jgi:hypothetical protein
MAFTFVSQQPVIAIAPANVAQRLLPVQITLDGSSYAAGGVVITPASLGLTQIIGMYFGGAGIQGSGLGVHPHWDRVNGKLKLYKSNTAALPTEIAAADVSTSHIVEALVLGF